MDLSRDEGEVGAHDRGAKSVSHDIKLCKCAKPESCHSILRLNMRCTTSLSCFLPMIHDSMQGRLSGHGQR